MTTIFEALNTVASEVGAVAKRDRNQQQGFSFRGVDAVVNAVSPCLRKAGVIIVPEVLDVEYTLVEVGQRRTPMSECRVRVRYIWFGPSGDSIASTVVAAAMDSGDKSCPKAMSVAYRTCILQVLTLPTDDPEPDSQTFQRSANRARATDSEYSATDPQAIRRRMFGLYRTAGVGIKGTKEEQRKERLDFASAAIGRTISSSDELSADEVGLVIAALQAGIAEQKRETP